jgi:tetratricopeptide (TPR) repeat protein
MPDVPLSALDARQLKLVENARVALGRGNHEYVLAVCEPLLQTVPACVAVRRLERAARLAKHRTRNSLFARAMSGLSLAPYAFGGGSRDAADQFARMEKLLQTDPGNLNALKLQAAAATDLDWPETAIFLREAVRAIVPSDRDNLLALGAAWLVAGRADEALHIADEILRDWPVDHEAQNLMRKASIAQSLSKGKWETAGDYRQKLAGESKSPPLVPAGEAAAADGTWQKADTLKAAREAVERNPIDAAARIHLASLLEAAGETEPAMVQYQQAMKSPNVRIPAQLGLARCFRARGLSDMAVAQLETARTAVPEMDELKKEIIYELGSCLEQMGRSKAALALFQEIYAVDIGYRDTAAKINASRVNPSA